MRIFRRSAVKVFCLCALAAEFPLLLAQESLCAIEEEMDLRAIGELEEETGYYQSLLVDKKPVFVKQSKYQKIEVHQSHYYGKVLVLDDVVQLTERDADSYNEMMTHMAMFQHAAPERVLVIGGGDGYVVNEVLKHASVKHVDHVDLDEEVIETCKEYFSWGQAWEDDRVTLHIGDGAAFVRDAPASSYDVIIQDSSDPWTTDDTGEIISLPSVVLYTQEHFSNVNRILKPDGIFNFQGECVNIPIDLKGIAIWRQQALDVGFQKVRYGSLMISSYPTGQIGFLLCEKDPSRATNSDDIARRYRNMVEKALSTSFYHPPMHESSFVLPLWVQQAVYTDNPEALPLNLGDEL